MTRSFSPEPLPTGLLPALLDVARRAPSAGFSQGVHFLVLDGDELARFWRTTGADEWFTGGRAGVRQAPAVVLPLADPTAYTTRYAEGDKAGHGLDVAGNWPVPFWLTDTAMAVQNLLLLAEDRGLGALYFGLFRNARRALDELGVPAHVEPLGAVAIGYRAADDVPSGSPQRRGRRPAAEVVHLGRW
jgi:nitroreductase